MVTTSLGSQCRINGIEPEMIWAVMVAQEIFYHHDLSFVWSSGVDREHSTASLHYVGYAIDVWPGYVIDPELVRQLADMIRGRVGQEFDVLAEVDHVHIEFQPKRPLNKESA